MLKSRIVAGLKKNHYTSNQGISHGNIGYMTHKIIASTESDQIVAVNRTASLTAEITLNDGQTGVIISPYNTENQPTHLQPTLGFISHDRPKNPATARRNRQNRRLLARL
ncbi:MAG: hypothetical protein PSV18_14965 [Methylobacter sp.]|nr:hypothetical protein [Candidatus Methylobacter titanis]